MKAAVLERKFVKAPKPVFDPRRCKVCRCTHNEPCEPPCGWSDIEPDLCTGCEDVADAYVEWLLNAVRPSHAALKRVINERFGEVRYLLAEPPK